MVSRRASETTQDDDAPSGAPASPPADLIAVGRIVDAYGVHGWVKIQPYNVPTDSVLKSCRRWWMSDGAAVAVEKARVHAASIVAKPQDVTDRDAALRLKGQEIRVSRQDFPAARAGEFYWVDLVGCAVVNPSGDDLGAVYAVEDYGAHPILKTRAADGRERMLPFVEVYILEVDVAGRKIVADWMPEY